MVAKPSILVLAAFSLGLLALSGRAITTQAQAPPAMTGPNAILHVVSDLGRSVRFYRELVGLEPDASPAFPSGNSRDVATLTNVPGAELATATFRIPGSEVRLVLMQFTKGGTAPLAPRLQDFGQAKTVIRVRDIDAQFAKVRPGLSKVLSSGGGPVRPEGPQGVNRAVITLDPDGSPLEFVYQTVPPIPDTIPASTNVVGGWASLVVEDLPTTIAFYHTHFGFEPRTPGRQASEGLLALQGLPDAKATMSTGARIPGSIYSWFLYAYGGVERRGLSARLTQPGATAISVNVSDLGGMLASLRAAGRPIETTGGRPVTIDGAERVFVRDPSGILIEIVQRRP